MFFHGNLVAVDVYDIAQGLEGVKRNADGQHELERDILHRQREGAKQRGDGFAEEVEILKEEQHAKADDQRENHKQLRQLGFLPFRVAEAVDQKPAGVGDKRGERNQHHELRIPAHIEIVARNQQHDPAESLRQEPVQDEDQRQENSIGYRVKQHVRISPVVSNNIA